MKKQTRIAALLLAGLFLASCGENTVSNSNESGNTQASSTETTNQAETATGENTEAETKVSLLDQLETKNYEGRVYTILDANDHIDMHVNIHTGELTGEAINDALYNRDIRVMDKFNTKIEYQQPTNASTGTGYFKQAVLGGTEDYSMITTLALDSGVSALTTNGILLNLNLVDDPTNWSQVWWNPLMYENMQLNGKFYFTTGDIAAAVYQAPFCVFYNSTMGLDYGHDVHEIYEAVRNGEWTYEKMYQIADGVNQDVNQDGKYRQEDDIAGILAQSMGDYANAYLISCGLKLSTVEEGHISVNFYGERAEKVVETVHKIYDPEFTYGANEVPTNKAFPEGRGLFLIHKVETATAALRDMDDDFSILPMPKLDVDQDGYFNFMSGYVTCFVGLPLNTGDISFAGTITEALGRAAYETVRPAAYETTLKGKTARDAESIEMLDIIFNSLYLDFQSLQDFGGLAGVVNTCIMKGEGLASSYAKTAKILDRVSAKFETAYFD